MYIAIRHPDNLLKLKTKKEYTLLELHKMFSLENRKINRKIVDALKIKNKNDLVLYKDNEVVKGILLGIIADDVYLDRIEDIMYLNFNSGIVTDKVRQVLGKYTKIKVILD